VLPFDLHPHLANIRSTTHFVLGRIAAALRRWEPATAFRGISDLAIGEMKVSGNAQRRQRRALLVHGTILYDMPAQLIARYLTQPLRQPDYRQNRAHSAFLRTIDAPPKDLKLAIAEQWAAGLPLDSWPVARMPQKVLDVLHRTDGVPRSLIGCHRDSSPT
jgi:lipoate-protein ligase A